MALKVGKLYQYTNLDKKFSNFYVYPAPRANFGSGIKVIPGSMVVYLGHDSVSMENVWLYNGQRCYTNPVFLYLNESSFHEAKT